MRLLVTLAVAGALLAGCGGGTSKPEGAPPDDTIPPSSTATTPLDKWHSRDIASYDFVYHAGGMAGECELFVHVRDGKVASATEQHPCWLHANDAPTIDGVFDTLAKEYRESDQVDATYDPEYGFPTSVSVDRIRNAIDDEWGFGVSDFVPK